MERFLAIDLGATSGRAILGIFDGKRVSMEEVLRFANPMIPVAGHLYWDLLYLYNQILKVLGGFRPGQIRSVGIDSWGCDIALFDEAGELLCLPYCYRDSQTDGAATEYCKKHEMQALYERTGTQFMDFNTLFQLDTLRRRGSVALRDAAAIQFIPDALVYMLTGQRGCEYTIASTSQLLDVRKRTFDGAILSSLNLDARRFSPDGSLCEPGTLAGSLGGTDVVRVASHDTASAVVSIPVEGNDWAYLSCGTWSLMGVERGEPLVSEQSYRLNFTNEGGPERTVRFLKNIGGLYLLERCKICPEFSNAPFDPAALTELAKRSACRSVINPDAADFAHPQSMTKAIRDYCRKTSQEIPKDAADYASCIFRSLAAKYASTLSAIDALTGEHISTLHVIGGGSMNGYLMQLTADSCGVEVVCGPAEGSSLGNILMQIKAAHGDLSLGDLRSISRASCKTVKYNPTI